MIFSHTKQFIRKFQNTNPERGRKLARYDAIIRSAKSFQNTNPERGRKQARRRKPSPRRSHQFQNTNPERGRKRDDWCRLSGFSPALISEHEPRKGTETAYHVKISRPMEFQNTNPERGRKQFTIKIDSNSLLKFQNTNPERGRKLREQARDCKHVFGHFRTRTPKGDGNHLNWIHL